MKYRGILFDKDGTLLDFNRTWLPVYLYAALEFAEGDTRLADRLLREHGYAAEQDRFIGGSLLAAGNNRQIAEAWASQTGRPGQVDALSQRLNEIFHDHGARHATAVEGLASTLGQLKGAGYRLGVATADSHQGIVKTLESFDVLRQFDFLAGYDSGHGVKPEPGMVLAFCEQTALGVDAVVVVGDNRHDIEMGRNAGAGLCVGVLTGTSTRDDLEDIADIVLDDIGALPGIV
ncbi:MAG: HAD family hydrolase [Gammaproteobacteria bacterium]|nr:HAD family hydrolase [Gammaproteobacteria bacterium]MDH3535314.1 HAD family hydrolase [Gammaproteobacteria bacterium]